MRPRSLIPWHAERAIATDVDGGRAIGSLLRARARETPGATGVVCGDDVLTFADLDERADRVSAGFAGLGVGKGDRVAIVAPNRTELFELYFGLARLGAIQVPLNAFLKGEFLRHQLAQSAAKVLVADGDGWRAAAPLVDGLSDLDHVVRLDPRTTPAVAVASGPSPTATSSRSTAAAPDVDVRPDDVMSIVYTSGTTGLPKGCVLTHGYYARVGTVMNRVHELTADDVLLTALPMFHGAARMMVVASGLVRGIPVVVEPEFSAGRFVRRAAETGATVAYGVGAMGMALLATPPGESDRAHRLRAMMLVPFSEDHQAAFTARFGVDVWAEGFGQTECVPISWHTLSGPRRRATCGRPGDDLDVAILDDDDRPVPTGDVGEICLRPRVPHAMFAGYWRQPDETLRRVPHALAPHRRPRAHRRGGLAPLRRPQEGRAPAAGRERLQPRARGGDRPPPEHRGGGRPRRARGGDGGRHQGVHRPPRAAPRCSPRELFEFFRSHLPYFAIPRYVEVVEALPRNAAGRVMKFQLAGRAEVGDVWDLDALGLTVPKAQRR